jgi:1,4-alpha-glucan branching enzyme
MLHPEDIAALMDATHPDPFAVLGMQQRDGALWVHALMPGAVRVDVLDRSSGRCVAGLQRLADSEVFGRRLDRRNKPFDYLLRVQWPAAPGQELPAPQRLEDPYRFGLVLGELDVWLLAEGTHHRPHQCLGAHPREFQGVAGVSFAVWAPNAQRVSVVGPFNGWDGRRLPMRPHSLFSFITSRFFDYFRWKSIHTVSLIYFILFNSAIY